MSAVAPRSPGTGSAHFRSHALARQGAMVLGALLLCALPACNRSTPAQAQPDQQTLIRTVDARAQAHADLAHRLRRFLIERGAPGQPRGPIALDDERFRLGAFWRSRTDTHHFGAAFQTRAQATLAAAGAASDADIALRQLQATVDARLADWQALVDYNASGDMRDDGGDEGRRLLPWAIAAIDAIEAATWNYLDTFDTAQAVQPPD